MEGIDRVEALKLYEESKDPLKALDLYKRAFDMRQQVLGNKLKVIVPSGVILDCKLKPPCRYCRASSGRVSKEGRFETVLQGLSKLKEIGIDELLLVGGTNLDGYDEEIIGLVERINNVSDISIDINFGCSISRDTVKRLKGMNVTGITSSLEVYNKKIFKDAKPGDSHSGRCELLEITEEEDLKIRSFMMLGIGESDEDRIDHLFYLRGFRNMKHLVFSRFVPSKGTPYGNKMPCPSWDVARTIAIARLIMPNIYISTSHNSGLSDIPLWYMAGGNEFFGINITRMEDLELEPGERLIAVNSEVGILDRTPVVEHQIQAMGCSVEMPRIEIL